MSHLTKQQELEQFQNVATLVEAMKNLKEQGCSAGYRMHQGAKKESKEGLAELKKDVKENVTKIEKKVESNSRLVKIVGAVCTAIGIVIGLLIKVV